MRSGRRDLRRDVSRETLLRRDVSRETLRALLRGAQAVVEIQLFVKMCKDGNSAWDGASNGQAGEIRINREL